MHGRWDLPASVTVIDAGTPGLGLITLLADCDVTILVDCVNATGSSGELRCYNREQLQALPRTSR